jgi:hypothetical protein
MQKRNLIATLAPHAPPHSAAQWATATKNVKKPLGEKGRTFRKSKILLWVQETF